MFSMGLRFYLAGKISHTDWRNVRGGPDDWEGIGNRKDGWEHHSWTPLERDGDIISGPFFLADDHGCAHGPTTHGNNLGNEYNCFDILSTRSLISRKNVYRLCCEAIASCDVVLAWLGTEDGTAETTAYGTLFELGYAASQGKEIIIGTDFPERTCKELWFAFQSASVYVLKGPEELWINRHRFFQSEDRTPVLWDHHEEQEQYANEARQCEQSGVCQFSKCYRDWKEQELEGEAECNHDGPCSLENSGPTCPDRCVFEPYDWKEDSGMFSLT